MSSTRIETVFPTRSVSGGDGGNPNGGNGTGTGTGGDGGDFTAIPLP